MISFDSTKNHDYLDVPTMKRLIESGVDTSDSRYYLYKLEGNWYLGSKDEKELLGNQVQEYSPTYGLPELLYKLNEWHPEYKGLAFWKDAPFYAFYYREAKDYEPLGVTMHEYPTYAAAELLIKCMKEGFGCALIKDKS